MGNDVVVHVAIYRQNMPKLNNYYVVKFIRLCICGLAFLGKGSICSSHNLIATWFLITSEFADTLCEMSHIVMGTTGVVVVYISVLR